jgi:tRNA modification GTPase
MSFIDEALVIYFKAPNSFTGEDVVEFQCHGGVMVASMIIDTLLQYGARLAMPGEFSKRAFLNDKMDFSQAQAIASLIEAKSEDAAHILARQMRGSLGQFIDEARESLLHILAHVEVSIDYAEEDLPLDLLNQIRERLNTFTQQMSQIVQISQQRKGLIHGFRVAIVGKPNVGKSSLLNTLLQNERAIISDIAGTTRDTIEEELRIGTHLIKIIDTAGIRQSSEAIEQIGIARSRKAVDEADIILALFDGSLGADNQDKEILSLLHNAKKETFYIINKSDLPQSFDASLLPNEPMRLSAKEDANSLINKLTNYLDSQESGAELLLTSTHQIHAVSMALEAINEANFLLEEGSLELFAFHLNEAINALGSITKPYGVDEMLDKMFGTFCLGK